MRLKSIVASLALIMPVSGVFAAGFQLSELSASLQGQAIAGAAAADDDASAMGYNPATLASVKGNQVSVGGSIINPNVSYYNATAREDVFVVNPTNRTTSEANITPIAYVPNAYAAFERANGWHYGVAVYAPFGLETSYAPNWVGALNGTDSELKTIDFQPTISKQLTPTLSIGMGLIVEYMQVNLDQASLAVPIDFDVKASNTGLGAIVGLVWTPTADTAMGLSYRSSVVHNLSGTATLSALHSGLPAGDVSSTLKTPEEINLGLSQKVTDRLTVLGTAEWIRWSSMQALSLTDSDTPNIKIHLPLEWKNTWLLSLGNTYRLTDKWTLRDGVAYDQTPTQNLYRDPRIPDADRYWLTVGATYAATQHLQYNAVYEHIFIRDQSVNVSQTLIPAVTGHVSAEYKGSVDIFGVSLNYRF